MKAGVYLALGPHDWPAAWVKGNILGASSNLILASHYRNVTIKAMNCPSCGKVVLGLRSTRKFCSTACRMRAHRRRSKLVAAKAGDVSLLKTTVSALKQANTKQEKKLKEAEAEIARLKNRERSGISWRNPENAVKMFVSVGKAEAANKPYSAWNRDGSEWALGDSPLEALGSLVHGVAMHRPVMVMAVEFQ